MDNGIPLTKVWLVVLILQMGPYGIGDLKLDSAGRA